MVDGSGTAARNRMRRFNVISYPIWATALGVIILSVLLRRHVTKVASVNQAAYRIEMIARAITEPIWQRTELPQMSYRDKNQKPTISWRADIVNDFKPGKPVAYSKSEGLYSAANLELLASRNQWICNDPSANGLKTSVFAVANGQSLFEIGNEWRLQREIPSDAIIAVYLSFVVLDHWALPGDICVGNVDCDTCVTTLESLEFPAGGIAVCVFWDRTVWALYQKSELEIALKFADLSFANQYDRDKILAGLGERIGK